MVKIYIPLDMAAVAMGADKAAAAVANEAAARGENGASPECRLHIVKRQYPSHAYLQ